jgi:hypothetical protein
MDAVEEAALPRNDPRQLCKIVRVSFLVFVPGSQQGQGRREREERSKGAAREYGSARGSDASKRGMIEREQREEMWSAGGWRRCT